MSAFTTSYEARSLRLINEVVVLHSEHAVKALAKWDTGADKSCVSYELASALNLESDGTIDVITPSGPAEMPTYTVDIALPGDVKIDEVSVAGSEIGREGIHVLVGMDIISLGDFAASCKDGKTKFTFRVPSIEDADYVVRQ